MLAMRRVMGLEALERLEARRRAVAAEAAAQADTAAQAAARVEELRRRMAELATSIRELEAQAQQLGGAQAGEGAPAGADAQRQVEAIDALLDGVRTMRAALEEQRAELALAEERVQQDDAGRTAQPTEEA